MDVADCEGSAKLSYLAQDLSCDIGAARNVADVFRQLFFTAIRADETCLDNYLRHCCN